MNLFRRNKIEQLRWGREPNQVLDLYRPQGQPRGVVAMVHGGFWRSMYGREGIGAHCLSLAAEGFTAANLAYRRVGDPGGGWPNTGTDVAAGLQALTKAHGPITAVVGHSAGGHLALWAAKELDPRPKVVVSVAGCNDLALAQSMGAGNGAVDDLLGGDLSLLAGADPAQRVPLGTAVTLVVADIDPVVPALLSESYALKAQEAGDVVKFVLVRGDHFSVLDVGSAVWTAVADAIGSHA